MCLPHNMVFVKSLQFILILNVCIYIHNYWEFCLINLRIANYFVDLVTMHLQLNDVLCQTTLPNYGKIQKLNIFSFKKKILISKMSNYSLFIFFFIVNNFSVHCTGQRLVIYIKVMHFHGKVQFAYKMFNVQKNSILVRFLKYE